MVIDLFARQVVGWSMSERINTDLVIDAITMASWRHKPKTEVLVHSDQGCQFIRYDLRSIKEANNLKAQYEPSR